MLDLYLIFMAILSGCLSEFPYRLKHVENIGTDDINAFRAGAAVSTIYYYKKNIPRLKAFFKEYDTSAEYLKLYGLKVGVVKCEEQPDIEKCQEDGTDFAIYTYSHGNMLLQLEMDTMFDVNSIMSNILQLALLREVPILQTEKERLDYENRYKGSKDIIFSFQKAIGTYEHRIFMEVAYAFQHKFKFAISTTKESVTGLLATEALESLDSATIWCLSCAEIKQKDQECGTKMYDEKMDLTSLASFIKRLTLPISFKIPKDGSVHPYTKEHGLHLVYFLYRRGSEDTIDEIIKMIGNQFLGTAAFISINLDSAVGYDFGDRDTPSVGVQLKSESIPVFMTDVWSLDAAFEFFINRFQEYDSQTDKTSEETSSDVAAPSSSQEDESSPESSDEDNYIEEVETEDDQVAEAVSRARRIKLDLDLVAMLTDKTFPTTVKEKNLVFVLFYLPFDHRSMAFLRAYGEASRKYENETVKPFAAVNCHDWTDVCANENITQYPILKIFESGKKLKDYDGMLSRDDVVKTYKLLSQSTPIKLSTKTGIQNYIEGTLPDKSPVIGDISVLGLFLLEHEKEISVYQEVAQKLQDKITFGIDTSGMHNDILKNYGCEAPCIVLLKKSDILQPYIPYKGKITFEDLVKFIEESQIPALAELTPGIFPKLYMQNKPFVISFIDETESSAKMLQPIQDIVKKSKYSDLIFCSAESSGAKSFGRQILQTYQNSTESSLPALSYAHLKQGKVYNYLDKPFTLEGIQIWLKHIKENTIDNSKLVELKKGVYKPVRQGYHFLEFIEKDANQKKKTTEMDDIKSTMNAQGIGFDSEGNEVEKDDELSSQETTTDTSDVDIRKELVELQKSRLYHQAEGKHKTASKKSQDSNKDENSFQGKQDKTLDKYDALSNAEDESTKTHKIVHEDL